MAVASQSGQSRRGSSRGRAQAKRAGGSSSRSASASKNGTSKSGANSRSATTKSRSSSSRSKSSAARSTGNSSSTRAKSPQASNASSAQSSNGSSNGQHETLTNLGVSVFSAAVGVVGGVLLTRKTSKQHRKVLGVSVPDKIDFSGVADQIGTAGRQFGELAGEVRAVREKAEQIGRLFN